MNNKNNNYRVMKFLEPVNKSDKSKGYVRLDIRGIKGTLIVSVENLGDNKTTSEVYLYKDKNNKIKVGTVNNRKGMIKRTISLSNNSTNFEDYNICGVVKDNKIVLYANLFNAANLSDVKKLEETVQVNNIEGFLEEKDTFISDEIANNGEEHKETKKIDEIDEIKNKLENAKTENKDIDEAKNIDEEKEEQISQMDVSKKDEIAQKRFNSIDEDKLEIKNENEDENEDENKNGDEQENIEAATKKVIFKSKFEENLYNSLKDYKKINPLSVEIKSMNWWKVPYDDRGIKGGFLPYYDQIVSSYYPYPVSNRVTTCHGLMRKYGYYLFGIYKDDDKNIKRFVYGIPGEFKREEQPYKGITGFKNWSYKNKEINGDYGFWLAFVDSNTGEVTEPPKVIG